MSTKTKSLSAFATAALALDADFEMIRETALQLERLDIKSDGGLKRGKILLARFGECGERVGTNIQALSQALNEAQVKASEAAQMVSAKATEIQSRHQQEESLHQRFNLLSDALRKFNEVVLQIRDLSKSNDAEGGATFMVEQLPKLTDRLVELADEVRKIEDEAKSANLKSLQKDANALAQSMLSMRRKLESISHRFAH